MHGHESWQRMGILKVKKEVRSLNPVRLSFARPALERRFAPLTAKYKGRPPQGDAARQEDVGRRARKALAEMNANKK